MLSHTYSSGVLLRVFGVRFKGFEIQVSASFCKITIFWFNDWSLDNVFISPHVGKSHCLEYRRLSVTSSRKQRHLWAAGVPGWKLLQREVAEHHYAIWYPFLFVCVCVPPLFFLSFSLSLCLIISLQCDYTYTYTMHSQNKYTICMLLSCKWDGACK